MPQLTPTIWKANKNNAFGTLSAQLTASGTSFSVTPTGSGAIFATTYFWVTIENPDGTNKEIVLIKTRSGDNFTIDRRAEQGSAAVAHAAGSYVRMLITAGHLDEIEAAIGRLEQNAISGGSTGTTPPTSTGVTGQATINFVIDAGGSAITAGEKGYMGVIAGTIKKVELFADQNGNCQVDITRASDVNWPASNSLIVSGQKPVLSGNRKYIDTTLAGWNTGLNAGDVLTFTVVSVSTITRLTVVLTIDKSDVAPPIYTGPIVTFAPTPIAAQLGVEDPSNPTRSTMSFGNVIFGPPELNLGPQNTFGYSISPKDVYMDFSWYDLEADDGLGGTTGYDFTTIDTYADMAHAQGGRLNFRVFAMDIFVDYGGGANKLYPEAYGAPGLLNGPNGSYAVPPQNDDGWLGAATSLIGALSSRYNNDPRIGVVFIGLLGHRGAFRERYYNVTVDYLNPITGPLTSSSIHYIIDQYYNAFTAKRLVVSAHNDDALSYALGLSANIGWYLDEWGDATMDSSPVYSTPSLVTDRWKTAPVMGVPAESLTGATFPNLDTQVDTWHISELANINGYNNAIGWDPNTISQTNLDEWTLAFDKMGFRLSLSVDVPQSWQNGPIQINTHWNNIGVTPCYHPWRVVFILQTAAGQDVWTAISSADLTAMVPGTLSVIDNFGMGQYVGQNNVLPGTYNFCIRVDDVDGYFDPMQLDIAVDRQASDGRYILGTVTVTS